MSEHTKTYKISEEERPLKSNPSKPQWQRPTLTFLGRVKDLVQGFGKTGSNADSDPQLTQKSGVG